jgi:hypothetical protein
VEIPETASTSQSQQSPAAGRSLRWRGTQLLAEFRRRAHGGVVCETTGTLAKALGVSNDTVRRGLTDLISAGLLEETPFRDGKARAFRLVESPQAVVESPQALRGTDSPQLAGVAAGDPLRGVPPAAHLTAAAADAIAASRPVGSPMADEDREWFATFEWTPELLAHYTARARTLAERYSRSGERPELEQLGEGECDDCHQPSERRERYGAFALCVACVCRRHSVAMKLEAQIASAKQRPA